MSLEILFVTPELDPLLKVGGLADVARALPRALAARGHRVRILLPRIASMPAGQRLARLGSDLALRRLEGEDGVEVLLFEHPALTRRERLYQQADGRPWDDDPEAFDAFARCAAALAGDRLGLGWKADVVHGHDWPCGLVPVHLMLAGVAAASVFTIHNLAHHGDFEGTTCARLGLPGWLMHPEAMEFWGCFSFIKGGLKFSDWLTTVSPRYAREILGPERGEGLDGVLRSRAERLEGILNGLDYRLWDPWRDPHIAQRYSASRPGGKATCRAALLAQHRLDGLADGAPLLGWIGRLYAQKGVDLLLEALPAIVARGLGLVLLGSGEPWAERALIEAAARWPRQVAVSIGYDEAEAHRIHAGADLFLMPSRYEPCGLTQLCALRYGALPVVHAVGGLADTVVDASPEALAERRATGFSFEGANAGALLAALERACRLYREAEPWSALQARAMRARFDWSRAAQRYESCYDKALAAKGLRTP